MTNEKVFFSLLSQIRTLLRRDWDPIGVGDDPDVQNEYDSYAFDIYRMLEDAKTVHDLENYLLSVESERMSIQPNKERAWHVARNIFALKNKSEKEIS